MNYELPELPELLWDAYMFFLYFRYAVEECPLQLYTSVMTFTPRQSYIRKYFGHESPRWVKTSSFVLDQWPSYFLLPERSGTHVGIAYSRDSHQFVSATSHDIEIRDTITGALLQKFQVSHDDEPGSTDVIAALSKDGIKFAIHRHDLGLKVLDILNKTWLELSEGHFGAYELIFSNDSRILLSISNSLIRTWDTNTGRLIICQTWVGKPARIVFLGNSTKIALVLKGGNIAILDAKTGCYHCEFSERREGTLTSVQQLVPFPICWSLLFSVELERISLYNLATGAKEILETPWNYSDGIFRHDMDMAISTSEDIVAILAEDSLHIYRRHKQRGSMTPRIEYTTTVSGSFATCRSARIVFSEDSRFLAAIRSDTQIEVWDMNLSKRTSLFKFDAAVRSFTALVFNPDSTFLAASIIEESGKTQTRIWKVDSSNKTLPCGWDRGNTALVYSVQFSNDSQWLAVRFSSLRAELWRCSGEPQDSFLDGENDQVTDLAFSWDSTKLGYGTNDGKVKILDMSSNRTKHLYDTISRAEKAKALSFSRDDTLLAARISDLIRIYNMKTGLYHDLKIPGSDFSKSPTFPEPNYCNISVFKNWTVVAEQQGRIYLWDASKVVKVFSLDDILTPMRGWGDVVSTDLRTIGGRVRIVLGSNNGGIHIIDVGSGNVLHSVETGPLSTLATHQDDNTFVSTSQGDIDLAQFYLDETETFHSPNPNDIIYRGYGVSGSWILKDGKRIIWLPPQYRTRWTGLDFWGKEFAVSNSQLAILCNKGQRGGPGPLLLLHFSQHTIDFGSWE